MLFGILVLLTSLAMASVAAWFAVTGIMAFFAGNVVYGLAMGIVIELGKLVAIAWAYRSWNDETILKYICLPLILVALLLTSSGIFGTLSKAHIEQKTPVANNELNINRLEQRIATEQYKIDDARQLISQLDTTVNTLIEYAKISDEENGARAVRERQKPQREELNSIIESSQSTINTLENEKLELQVQLKAIEIELGPIKYVADVLFGEGNDRTEEAARYLILAFIFVFDPMAIVLLMCANHTFMKNGYKNKYLNKKVDIEEDVDSIGETMVQSEPEQQTDINEELSTMKEYFENMVEENKQESSKDKDDMLLVMGKISDSVESLMASQSKSKSSILDDMRTPKKS